MATERQIPGGAFINETGTRQAQVPGGVFANETAAAAGGGPTPNWLQRGYWWDQSYGNIGK